MPPILIVLYGLAGAAVGSFLNVVIDRAPQRASLLQPGSHCPHCGRDLTARDLIPIVSYITLRGRCRTCGAAIPLRVLVVEAVTALLFAWLVWYRGPSFELLADTAYGAIFVVITVIDLEHKLILNRIVYPATLLALAVSVLRVVLSEPRFLHIGYWMAAGWAGGSTPEQISVLSQWAGGLVGLVLFFIIYLAAPRGGMGDGDVRLATLAGLITGFPGVLVAVFGSFILGGLTGGALLITGKASRQTAIPFAPFLVLSTWAVNMWGDAWLLAYILG